MPYSRHRRGAALGDGRLIYPRWRVAFRDPRPLSLPSHNAACRARSRHFNLALTGCCGMQEKTLQKQQNKALPLHIRFTSVRLLIRIKYSSQYLSSPKKLNANHQQYECNNKQHNDSPHDVIKHCQHGLSLIKDNDAPNIHYSS